MKYSAKIAIVSFSAATLLFPVSAFANVSVHVSDNGEGSSSNVSVHQDESSQTTTCRNGVCTTTGSGGESTVCHNGDCKTYTGDVHYESDNGHTKVQIDNSNEGNVTPRPTEILVDPQETSEPEHHFFKHFAGPTSTSAQLKSHKKADAIHSDAKKMMKEQNGSLSNFFATLQNFFKSMFH